MKGPSTTSPHYRDTCLLPAETTRLIVLFGGKQYAAFFTTLTARIRAPRTILYRGTATSLPTNCRLVAFETRRRTNWHYACAEAFLDGRLDALLDG